MIIRNILSQKQSGNVKTIKADALITDAIDALAKFRIGALIVSKDGTSVDGILSERDIVASLSAKGADVLGARIHEIMTKTVIACDPADSAVSVLEKMTDGRFRHMPVVDEGKMIGVISIGDVVKARIGEVEQENTALTDMIAGHA
jgi:CBS domain-containing protein